MDKKKHKLPEAYMGLTQEDVMINILQSQKEAKEERYELLIKAEDFERRIEELEREVPINGAFNNYLTRLRRQRIVELMGGKQSKAYQYKYPDGCQYKTLTNKVFAEAGRNFKSEFNVYFYAELRQHQYQDAVKYWSDYTPSDEVMREINTINNQTELELYKFE